MKKWVKKLIVSEIIKEAKNGHAIRWKTINPSIIAEEYVQQWVRAKCMFGCGCFNQHYSCPPHTGSLKDTKRLLGGYKHALLIEFNELTSKDEQQKIRELMVVLEKKAFLGGYYKAFALAGGPCRQCPTCGASETGCAQKPCAHPENLRPSMEAMGIDVYGLAKHCGWKLKVAQNQNQPFKSYGLLLLK